MARKQIKPSDPRASQVEQHNEAPDAERKTQSYRFKGRKLGRAMRRVASAAKVR